MPERAFRRRRRPAPRTQFLAASLTLFSLATLAFAAPILFAANGARAAAANEPSAKQNPVLAGLPITELTEQQAILHALDQLGYGLRPGDVQRVEQMGLAKWIDQQLHPESIDDSAVDARLQEFPTLAMSSGTLMADFPRPAEAAKREGITVEEYRKEQQDAARAAMQAEVAREGGGQQAAAGNDPQAAPPAQSAPSEADSAAPAPADDSMQASNAAPSSAEDMVPDPLDAPIPLHKSGAQSNQTNQSAGDDSAPSGQMSGDAANGAQNSGGEMAGPARGGNGKGQAGPGNAMYNYKNIHTPQRIVAELAMAKVDRAVYSDRQLYEQMVDFWFNHFNIYAAKGQDPWLLTSFERDAIRPHAMGKFRDLLEATAKSPAMLFYLDNWLSVDPDAWKQLQAERAERGARFGMGPNGFPRFPAGNPQQQQQAQKQNQDRGLNENYGREIMELHTLGVDGGYTQQDVTEVARCFTGWTIATPRIDPQFQFNDRLHDNKPKLVLGHKIDYGGIKDGEAVLDLLARDPHTAHHISLEIAQHFVSDKPPDSLVDRMTKTYLDSDGDIRDVLHTMIDSPEFWSKDAYRAKIKTPFELVVSAARATGADATLPLLLVQWSARIGEPLYQCQPPTGYSDQADAWVNTGALLNRLNYSLALTGNRLRGVETDVASVLGAPAQGSDPSAALDAALDVFLGGEVSAETRDTLEKQLDTPQVLQAKLDDPVHAVNADLIAGLVLGSPEFQRR
jgi:uncharacterized protein (DUF1800 family)